MDRSNAQGSDDPISGNGCLFDRPHSCLDFTAKIRVGWWLSLCVSGVGEGVCDETSVAAKKGMA